MAESHRQQVTGWRKMLLMGLGTLSLAVGVVGIFLPVLPTTCFLLLAAGCYSRSSHRFYTWLMTNRWFGRYLSDYTLGRGVPVGLKVMSVGSLWLSIGYVVGFVLSVLWVKLILFIMALAISYHVLSLPSRKPSAVVGYGYSSGID